MKQVRLNRAEIWIADHALPIFAVVALAIVVGAIAIVTVFLRADSAQDQVNVLRPQVTTINRAICDARSLSSEARARRCAERIRVGLVNCRRYSRCRAAFIAALTYPPPARGETSSPATGDTSRPPAPSTDDGSPAGEQDGDQGDEHEPSPGSHGDGKGGQGKGQEQAPSPSPGASPAPGGSEAPEPSPGGQKPPETGGGGAEGGQEGGSSGVGVELCVLEGTCVGLDVDVLPKGLTLEPPIRREGATPAAPEVAPPAP